MGYVITEHVYTTPDSISKNRKIQSDIFHDCLLPGDIFIVSAGQYVGNVSYRIIIELNILAGCRYNTV